MWSSRSRTSPSPTRCGTVIDCSADGRCRLCGASPSTPIKGENLGIVGESGCGKSTLSRLLSHLEAPDRGQILFKGQDIAHMSSKQILALRKRFQLLLQDPFNAIPPHLHIGRTIAEALRIHGGLSRKEIDERVRSTMAEVGLPPEVHDSLPVGLSAGQRQRVNIARAMVLEPELLILDETLSALDQVEQGKLLALFERLQVRHGITYIYISHDLSMVRRVCNRIAVMYLGRIVELATNEATFFDPGPPLYESASERRSRDRGKALQGRDLPARRRASGPD